MQTCVYEENDERNTFQVRVSQCPLAFPLRTEAGVASGPEAAPTCGRLSTADCRLDWSDPRAPCPASLRDFWGSPAVE